ncbi:hypothetical protein RRG08_008001 [Elysia crispata]|uniref:Uncharacterized protein n=1 Tax=Elysia crispata TaxID=231223 RepID=A0AAE1B1C6_9GAST|nr:hypothetical protein RRG08_008001 [Elysia crispata]
MLDHDITKACEIAAENAKTKLAECRETRSSHTRYREFSKGDKVLILLPQDGNNLFMRYLGLYILRKVANDTTMCVKSNKIIRLTMPTCSRNLRNVILSRLMTSYCPMQQCHASRRTL